MWKNMKRLKWLALFTSWWVWETYFKDIWIDIVCANELIEKRANFYSHLYPDTKMVVWDISTSETKENIIKNIDWLDIDFLIATPPCQWFSTLWKNKNQEDLQNDERNFLIFDIFYFIDKYKFNYILIENVPRYLDMYFPYKWEYKLLKDIINDKYSWEYTIDIEIYNAKDYWVPQNRNRWIIKLYKKWLKWWKPKKEKEITLEEAIWHLPSLESWEKSDIKWHYAKKHNNREVIALKNTPTWKSAMVNEYYYPKKEDWTKIKGFHNTYKRMDWKIPAHALTTNSWNIGSHNTVHPWRLRNDWTYSDARVLTIYELLILTSLPLNWNIPLWATDTFIRHMIWESVPPLMLKKIVEWMVN